MEPIELNENVDFEEIKRLLCELTKRMNMITHKGQIVSNDSSGRDQLVFSDGAWMISLYDPPTT